MNTRTLKLNCDMGEGLDLIDEEIMPYVGMANIACGFHAGDLETMKKTVALAKQYQVQIGAHPSFKDKEHFGRREMACSEEEIITLVQEQCKTLERICQSNDASMVYIKPHGALYNMMMKEMHIFKTLCKALSLHNKQLKLMILSNSQNAAYANIAQGYDIDLLYEVFADRAYTDEGQLVPRSQPGALLHTEEEVLHRAKTLLTSGYIESINGKQITLEADTLCVHSDTQGALALIKTLHNFLEETHAS